MLEGQFGALGAGAVAGPAESIRGEPGHVDTLRAAAIGVKRFLGEFGQGKQGVSLAERLYFMLL